MTGTFDILIDQVPSFVTSIITPVWTKADQSDIAWYEATRVDGDTFIVHVDIRNHNANRGIYYAQIYVNGGGYDMQYAAITETKLEILIINL